MDFCMPQSTVVSYAVVDLAQSPPLGVQPPGVRRSPDCEARPGDGRTGWHCHSSVHKDPFILKGILAPKPLIKILYLCTSKFS